MAIYAPAMDRLNYHHLLYFWMTVREGTVSRASAVLRLAQPTVSAQIHTLERSLGHELFRRAGRRLELTDVGRMVFAYADDIFSLGRELSDALGGRMRGRALHLRAGIADGVPKLISYRLLEPALALAEPVHLTIREDRTDRLLAALAAHELHIVFTDAPAGSGAPVRVFNHLLGECGVVLLARPAVARRWGRDFPAGLDGAPFLLPAAGTMMRRELEEWFGRVGIRPRIVGEFDDPALAKVFGQAGAGIFAAPAAIETEVRRQYGVASVGRVEGARERFYAISAERRLAHPAVVAISDTARARLFPPGPGGTRRRPGSPRRS